MNIKVNGKNVEIKEGATVSEVLASRNITPAGIAVAVDNTVCLLYTSDAADE